MEERKIEEARRSLIEMLPDYDWSVDGRSEDLISIKGLSFDKEKESTVPGKEEFEKLSKENPWYRVPIALDLSEEPIFWDIISKDQNLSSPHIGIIGYTGSGKSSLVKTIMRHINSKVDAKFFIANHRYVGYSNIGDIADVESSFELDETVRMVHKLNNIMQDRLKLMQKLGIDSIGEDCVVKTNKVIINNRLFEKDEVVKCYNSSNNSVFDIKAEEIPKLENLDSIEFLLDELDDGHMVKAPVETSFNENGEQILRPLFLIVDTASDIFDCIERPEFQKAERVKDTIGKILSLGRVANVHVILVNDTATSSIFSITWKYNLRTKVICGNNRYDSNIVRMFFDAELHTSNMPGAVSISSGNGLGLYSGKMFNLEN